MRFRVVAGAVVLVAVVAGTVLFRSSDDHAAADLKVDWGGSEGHPSCVYDPKARTVDATITITGKAPRREKVTVTVTAYADENTSEPVGTSSRSVYVEGVVNRRLHVAVPVEQPPLVDIDGETACGRSVKYGQPAP